MQRAEDSFEVRFRQWLFDEWLSAHVHGKPNVIYSSFTCAHSVTNVTRFMMFMKLNIN